MATATILPIKLELTSGTYYTLWAPEWKEHGSLWEGFLGSDTLYLFGSPEELLVYIQTNDSHDLTTHPRWKEFMESPQVVPADRNIYDLVWLPAYLADDPQINTVTDLGRAFEVTRALGKVLNRPAINRFFQGYSITEGPEQGYNHYADSNTTGEWDALGHLVHDQWDEILDELEVFSTPYVDPQAVRTAQLPEAPYAKKEETYQDTAWGKAGIDPIKITLHDATRYTLKTYLDDQPVFLGDGNHVFIFDTPQALLEGMQGENNLSELKTWDLLADSPKVVITKDNTYDFTGITEHIADNTVDDAQLAKAYELIADVADWSQSDFVNAILLGNEALQNFIGFHLGRTGDFPTPPFFDEVQGWTDLEDGLISHFRRP